jgi:Flp pilus assembly protein TadG
MKNFNTKGAVLIEFIISLSVLLLLFFGFFELYRFFSIKCYLQTSAYKIALWASKDSTNSNINTYIDIILSEGDQHDMAKNGTVIISGVAAGGTSSNTITWVIQRGLDASKVSSTWPVLYNNNFAEKKINSVIVELFYNYQPHFFSFSPTKISYSACIDSRQDL